MLFLSPCDGGDELPGNALNFYEHVFGKPRHFNGRPGRLMIAKSLFVDAVHGSKVVHRLEKYLEKP